MSMQQLLGGGRPLVLQRFEVNSQTGHVTIIGRKPGFVAFLFTLMGIDATTSMNITPHDIQVRRASLFGESLRLFALPSVASSACGYLKPVQYLFIALMTFLSTTYRSVVADGDSTIMLVGLVVAASFVLAYFLSKKLYIVVESSGGSVEMIVFKRSIIENVNVDIAGAREVISVIAANIVGNQNHGVPASLAAPVAPALGQLGARSHVQPAAQPTGAAQPASTTPQRVSAPQPAGAACPTCQAPGRFVAESNANWCDRCQKWL